MRTCVGTDMRTWGYVWGKLWVQFSATGSHLWGTIWDWEHGKLHMKTCMRTWQSIFEDHEYIYVRTPWLRTWQTVHEELYDELHEKLYEDLYEDSSLRSHLRTIGWLVDCSSHLYLWEPIWEHEHIYENPHEDMANFIGGAVCVCEGGPTWGQLQGGWFSAGHTFIKPPSTRTDLRAWAHIWGHGKLYRRTRSCMRTGPVWGQL